MLKKQTKHDGVIVFWVSVLQLDTSVRNGFPVLMGICLGIDTQRGKTIKTLMENGTLLCYIY